MIIAALLTFFAGYSVIIATTSIGYHRGLAHGAVRLHPAARWLLTRGGVWLTGIDPKGWVAMHRLHHRHSDTPDDPHSPRNIRHILVMFRAQLDGYNAVCDDVRKNAPRVHALADDLELSWPARSGHIVPAMTPYAMHVILAVAVGAAFGPWIGVALFTGLMSHVVQGVFVNYFGHAHGGRNFDSGDDSRNNHFVAWILLGEGFQNNHHRYPSSARFSYSRFEVDFGFALCRVLEMLRILRIVPATLIARAQPATAPASAAP